MEERKEQEEETPQECEIVLWPRLVECEILIVSVRMLCVQKRSIICQICPSAARPDLTHSVFLFFLSFFLFLSFFFSFPFVWVLFLLNEGEIVQK